MSRREWIEFILGAVILIMVLVWAREKPDINLDVRIKDESAR